MKKHKALHLVATIFLLISVFVIGASANSAEPPSVTIVVQNPPEDFSCMLIAGENKLPPSVKKVAWESQYLFHYGALSSEVDYRLEVTADGETYICEFPSRLSQYSGIFTLDLGSRKLSTGHHPMRSIMLVAIRLISTLAIEGVVFFLFGYRQKSSWKIFLIVNIITQGLLNIFLNGLVSGYIILALIFGEFFVFLGEMIAFPIALKEKSKLRAVLYALAANSASLWLGWELLSHLPV